jgi:DNA-binding NtrC family response regulator
MNPSESKDLYPILVAEDDPLLSLSIREFLEDKGFRVFSADSCATAIDILNRHTINVALVDKKLPDGEGTAISEHLLAGGMKTKMIMMTAYGADQKINEYVAKGAFDFLEKPFDLEKLLRRIENANHMFQMEYSQDAVKSYQKTAYQIIGTSPEIERIKQIIRHVAPSNTSVLIQGETGTGKELIARNIHLESDRSGKQFISVNCASIPENLFESEFFGYEKGAFTGAYKEKPGFFEMANYGSLHLDEIGEMPLEFQAKLLRVLEQGAFIKLGGTKEVRVNVRVIASTNKNLMEEVEKGMFREDLYFRIAVFTVQAPPLRDRPEDIPLLAEHIWQDLNLKMGRKTEPFPFSVDELKTQPWKGNVRELRNHLEKKLIYQDMGQDYQPEPISRTSSASQEKTFVPLEDYARDYVMEALGHFGYNKARTARALGMSLSTLKRKLQKWGVTVEKSVSGSGD